MDHFLTSRAIAAGGAVSGEHGIGVGKRESAAAEHGPLHVEVQRRIKRALDPLNIMNPGKFLPEARLRERATGIVFAACCVRVSRA